MGKLSEILCQETAFRRFPLIAGCHICNTVRLRLLCPKLDESSGESTTLGVWCSVGHVSQIQRSNSEEAQHEMTGD